MARGDVISGLAAVAEVACLVYQPAAGEEAVIKSVCIGTAGGATLAANYYVTVGIYDGAKQTSVRRVYLDDIASYARDMVGLENTAIFVTNAVYFRLYNAGAQTLGYSGIQTK